ncbi:MAG: heavy-metal-associated domain-containing protein [Verrucomicrobiales bacterium]|nr:heavy-metal-associated domain-containing protein [Verrucomicrobiales bacterium]MCP5527266.1 heavy-metal-associated domain-containing protein [Verrucomicrobiales bacterium]
MTTKTAKYALLVAAAVALPLTFQAQDEKTCPAGATCPVKTTACEDKSACEKATTYTSTGEGQCPVAAAACAAKTTAVSTAEGCCEKATTLTSTEAPACAKAGECCATKTADEGCCAKATTLTSTEAPACEKAGECCASKTTKTGYVKVSYQVDGLACAACETKLTKVLGAIDGVDAPEACAQAKVAKLSYDPKKVKEKLLVAAIEKAGYQVKSETIEVKVDGMSCEACSTKVSKALASVEGVKEQKVCHVAKQAVVTFDPKKISRDKVIAAIDSTGFKSVQ